MKKHDVVETNRAKNRKVWVEALRSGKYKQGRGSLRGRAGKESAFEFCCLGVGCDIIHHDGWVNTHGRFIWYAQGSVAGGAGIPPGNTMMKYFGLDVAVETKLIRANDKGVSFGAIATMIEELPLVTDGEIPDLI